jgi:hypothetical protein
LPSGSGYRDSIESGSNPDPYPDPDPEHQRQHFLTFYNFYDLKVTTKWEVVWVACLIESVKTVSILAMRTWSPLIIAITSMSANFSSLE